MRNALWTIVAAAALAACASTPEAQNDGYNTPVYRTGSNIPVKDRAGASTVQTVDPSTVQDAMRNKTGNPGGVSSR